ncbi:hypothetical protein [Luteipulveratus halotolerans]|uniref:Uncharacterized protein n=1 Tax=Luteipulveratus halotolerans TaxID=1631356 RepID=A0A0L6CKQ5_9MICO|nr:hypothetical protein [Luteipulveratus halotolerans]KNX38342.1 hypothetical protein VV01_16215 [Luteipulveratus halotolerans]
MLSKRSVSIAAAAALTAGVAATATATSASAEDSMCQTTTGSKDFYDGPSASATYDKTFHNSVVVPKGLYSAGYIPQGLAYWNNWNGTSEDVLLISAYKDDAAAIWGVVLNGSRRGQSLGHMNIPKTHAGGIAIVGGYVYVSGGTTYKGNKVDVLYWSASKVRKALAGPNGGTVAPNGYQNLAGAGSFLGKGGGAGTTLWTGTHDENKHSSMWQYKPSSTGKLTYTGKKRWVPAKTQGMTVVGDKYVFATSLGRNDRSNVWVRPSSYTGDITDGTSFCMRAPSMIEGLAYGNSDGNKHVWAIYESGANTYANAWDKPRNIVKHIHWAGGSALAGLYGQGD